jgi:hypothetical protein
VKRLEKFTLAIIADSDVEDVFDNIKMSEGYKNAISLR